MKELIKIYVSEHKNAWAATTSKSEYARLNALPNLLSGVSPEHIWGQLGTHGAYTRVTTWTRICSFYEWLIKRGHVSGPNIYKEWREQNARLFKHCYHRKQPTLSYSDARRRIETIGNREIKEKCLQLLEGGLRYSESNTFDSSTNTVVGKGSKRRRVYTGEVKCSYSYHTIYRHLKLLGLTPHALRKIAATEFRRRGLNEETLCQVMGWESFETARSYLKPEEEIAVEKILAQK